MKYERTTRGVVYHIGWGVRHYFRGFRWLIRHPSLFGLALIPILFTVIVLFALAAGSAWIIADMLASTLGDSVRLIIRTLVFVIALILGYFLYMPLARVLMAPFSEMLSRKAHTINTGNSAYSMTQGWARAMIEGLKLIAFQGLLVLSVVILSLSFPPVAAPAGFILATFLAGLDFLDVPLSARGIPLRNKLRIIWRNKSLAIGFGLAAHLMLLIPGVNLLLLPAGVIGATLMADSLESAGELRMAVEVT